MHSLIIRAHPSGKSFTRAIAESYRARCESRGGTVDMLDLYASENRLPFLQFEEIAETKNLSPLQLDMQRRITGADELIFVFPIWWVNMPAILKNFYDNVFTPWFAYKYQKWKSTPEKLLRGKTAKVYCTCDAPKYLYYLIGNPLGIIFRFGMLGFCGIQLKKFVIFDRMRKRTPEEREQMLRLVG